MIGVLRRRPATTFFGRQIPEARRRAAVASVLFYLLVLAAGVYALSLAEQHSLPDLTFEATSALGTVGLSRGITGLLTPTGKWIVILLMFLGRLGPVVFGMAMLRPSPASQSVSEEDLAV
jgi:trk system potassium uptake protein